MTDVEAKTLLLEKWRKNPTQDLAKIDVVDIRPREELEATWSDFFVRPHYAIQTELHATCVFRHVRRSCEAFAMATLQQQPWRENLFPNTKDLSELHAWLEPLLAEEAAQQFSSKPCL